MSERRPFEVVATRRGARAMLDRATGEVMHPLSGPIDEPRTLYLQPSRLEARLAATASEPLVLFDVGLGAGSNAAAAWALSEARAAVARPLHIVSFDRTLSALALALQPEHGAAFGFFGTALTAGAQLREHGKAEGVNTVWRVCLGELPSTLHAEGPGSADMVYWDPFSPRANPELWNVGTFTALRRVCRDRATVHTYSGATATRTALLLAGFAVGFGEVLPSGRQATVAAVRLEDLGNPLDHRWLARLARSSAPFPPDAGADPFTWIARQRQFRPAESGEEDALRRVRS